MKGKWRLAIASLVLAGSLTSVSHGDFELHGDEQLTVNTAHSRGWLYDQSRAEIVSGGSVRFVFAHATSTVQISGGSVDSLEPFDNSTVNMSSGRLEWLNASDTSVVDISGGSVTHGLVANNGSTLNISVEGVPRLDAYDSSVEDFAK